MTNLILIISRCLGKTKRNKESDPFIKFHFKGYYAGETIKMVLVKYSKNGEFQSGEEYLLWVRKISVQNGVLKVDLLNSKKI